MTKKEFGELKMQMKDGFDFILEEGQNTSTNLRKIAWGESGNFKIDIRKWSYQEAGIERALKGVTLSEDGGHELACVMVENGYGDSTRIMRALSERDDFEIALETYFEKPEEKYYDPSELLG